MQPVSEVLPEHFVTCSQSIMLECRCGQKLLLLGEKAAWCKEGRTVFECSECRERLSLKDDPSRISRSIVRRLIDKITKG
jgi:hypothetical protein